MANGELPIPQSAVFAADPTRGQALTPAWTDFFRQLAGSTGAVRAGAAFGRALIQEPPRGARDGSNTVFALSYQPVISDVTGNPVVLLALNGIGLSPFAITEQGWIPGGGEYAVTSAAITLAKAPSATDNLLATYFPDAASFGPGAPAAVGDVEDFCGCCE